MKSIAQIIHNELSQNGNFREDKSARNDGFLCGIHY